MRHNTLIIMLFSLILSGCATQDEIDQLSIANAKQPSNALTFIALDQGLFEKHGLEVKIESFPSGKRALQDGLLHEGFLKNEFDMAVTADVPFSFARQAHPDLKIFGHIFSANNVNRIIARQDSGITKLSELKDHKVATQKNSAVHFFLHRVLESQQINQDDLSLSYMKAEELPKALSNGTIDAFSMREPFISQASELLDGKVNVFSSPGIHNQFEVLVAKQQTLQAKPRAFEKFIKALLDAQMFVFQHPDQASEIVAKALGVSDDKVRQNWRPSSFQIGLQQGLLVTIEGQQAWINPELSREALPNVLDDIHFLVMQKVAPELISIVYGHKHESPATK